MSNTYLQSKLDELKELLDERVDNSSISSSLQNRNREIDSLIRNTISDTEFIANIMESFRGTKWALTVRDLTDVFNSGATLTYIASDADKGFLPFITQLAKFVKYDVAVGGSIYYVIYSNCFECHEPDPGKIFEFAKIHGMDLTVSDEQKKIYCDYINKVLEMSAFLKEITNE